MANEERLDSLKSVIEGTVKKVVSEVTIHKGKIKKGQKAAKK
ncbi:hypothetical protein [Latilactobacillus fragifolii]|nr:hypothetical protein [Latilactobacillus fragifolii]